MNVLVTGGAGYIGSHMVQALADKGCAVTVIDDLSTGCQSAVSHGRLIKGNIRDTELLGNLMKLNRFDAVIHFAAHSQVNESMTDPGKYYLNNTAGTLSLLEVMRHHGIKKLIFSSTAAIFGSPHYTPIDEDHPQSPISPYGHSKLMSERLLRDYAAAYGIASVSLRYFNAAGADPYGRLGECHEPESHLIPLVLQAASGRKEAITVYGRDYDTPDGTCVRDYIHVSDLCEAHWMALGKLLQGGGQCLAYNLGNGTGYSVHQVIEAAKKVTGQPIKVTEAPRRIGDPGVLIADSSKAQHELSWKPQYSELETIILHAWRWETRGRLPAP